MISDAPSAHHGHHTHRHRAGGRLPQALADCVAVRRRGGIGRLFSGPGGAHLHRRHPRRHVADCTVSGTGAARCRSGWRGGETVRTGDACGIIRVGSGDCGGNPPGRVALACQSRWQRRAIGFGCSALRFALRRATGPAECRGGWTWLSARDARSLPHRCGSTHCQRIVGRRAACRLAGGRAFESGVGHGGWTCGAGRHLCVGPQPHRVPPFFCIDLIGGAGKGMAGDDAAIRLDTAGGCVFQPFRNAANGVDRILW